MDVIVKLCAWRELRAYEIADLLGRSEKYILRKFITPLRESGRLAHTIPDMVNHPQQAYKAVR
jgi:ATP-dependent DNA helicase RecG